MLSRRLARPLMAAVFVQGGIDVLRNPGPRAEKARPVTDSLADALPLPDDPVQVVKINAAAHVVFGTLLAVNKLPRLSAAVLAGSLVPTTIGGHRFWEETDAKAKAMQRVHFMKNLAMVGGLIIAATDHEGSPSLSWRAKRAARKAAERARS